MASHFARWILTDTCVSHYQLPQWITAAARRLPEKRQTRFLAARILLAEMLLRLYGISQLPEIVADKGGRPRFADAQLPDFSIAYAGNIVGVLLAEDEGRVGLDMEIIRAHSRQTLEQYSREVSSAEKAWVQAQSDPGEAATQLWTMRQSVLKLTGDRESLQLHPASGRLRSQILPHIEAISDVEPLIVWSCAQSPGWQRLSLWELDTVGQKGLQEMSGQPQNRGPRALRLTSRPPEKAAQG